MVVYIHDEKFEVLNIIGDGTQYGERSTTPVRDANNTPELLEKIWIYNHGTPRIFSVNSEFYTPSKDRSLNKHSIELKPRPSWLFHKTEK